MSRAAAGHEFLVQRVRSLRRLKARAGARTHFLMGADESLSHKRTLLVSACEKYVAWVGVLRAREKESVSRTGRERDLSFQVKWLWSGQLIRRTEAT